MSRTFDAFRYGFTLILVGGWLGLLPIASQAGGASSQATDPAVLLDRYNVIWDSPSGDSSGSMPTGNGDIGLNAWIEKNGDLVFYISKTDAWSGERATSRGVYGLIKVGRVRVSFTPNPFAGDAAFRQELRLRDGAIEFTAGKSFRLLLWVDANRPVIHIESTGDKPVQAKVAFQSIRPVPTAFLEADVVAADRKNRIAWYYRNPNKDVPALINWTIGAAVSGDGLVSKNDTVLESAAPKTTCRIDIYPLTAQTPTPEEWLARLDRQITSVNAVDLEQARREHGDWWGRFWQRSWVFVTAGERAQETTQGYILQRFLNACSSRGDFPIKFNGSIWVVEHPGKGGGDGGQEAATADYRNWGNQYWFQNTRPMYWPMMMSGDFDLMQPLFRMYRAMLPNNARLIREYYKHDGAYFAETAPFWGGVPGPNQKSGGYTRHYYTPILELSAMMLDYYAYTGDKVFAKEMLLPIAGAGITFFDKHFQRDAKGKLLLEPDNAIETFWSVRNPLPDIAGLHFVLQGLLALPGDLTDPAARSQWQRLLGELPPVPTGVRNGKTMLLPFEDGQTVHGHNSENPELYAIYPFRLYGIGKPQFEIAQAAFEARKFTGPRCWSQNPVQAALLGDTASAKSFVIANLTNKDKRQRFPAFWAAGHDYAPDQDNGGNGLLALQHMLLQADGTRILLLPAWPKDWDVDFKLHAPFNTRVEVRVRSGKVASLKVTPEERRKDIEFVKQG